MGFITVDGENQIAAKQGAQQALNVVSFMLANISGLGPEPANRIESIPASNDIMATLPVTKSGYVNTNQVVFSLAMDSSLGDFDFNWVGLIDGDGILVAVDYIDLTQKRATNGSIPGNNLTRNFLIAFTGIQATTAISVPASTWQIDFTARLWGIDERERLSNYDIYGQMAFFGTGYSVVRQGVSDVYDVLLGVGYVGGIRIASLIDQQVTVTGPPKSIWLDVSLQGDISDVQPVVAFAVDAVAHPDYTDSLGFNHYLAKIAEIDASGNVTDARGQVSSLFDHEAKPDPHPQYLTQVEGDLLYKSILASSIPTSTVVAIPTDDVPNGYLECDGSAIDRTVYASLYALISTDYGTGDGSSTFNIPDLRGEFIRGFDNGRGVDVGRAIASFQADELRSHTHLVHSHASGIDGGGGSPGIPSSTESGAFGGAETRPRNIAMMFCIKY